MPAIHHATAKRAASLGIELAPSDDGEDIVASLNGKVLATASNGKAALAEAEAKLKANGDDEDAEDYDDAEEDANEDADENADEDADEDDEAPAASGSIVKPKYRKIYAPTHDSCGDDLATQLREHLTTEIDGEQRIDVKRLRRFADANGVWQPKYAALNPGQQRMNVGNRLRAKVRKGWDVIWAD